MTARWSDDRLDGEFVNLHKRVNTLPERVAVIEANLRGTREDLREVKQSCASIREDLVSREKAQASERASDRRAKWAGVIALVCSLVASLTVIVTQGPS